MCGFCFIFSRLIFHLLDAMQCDVDHNGVLDISEFTDYLTNVFEELSHTDAFLVHGASPREMAEATAQLCFAEADVNHDGELSFDEFNWWFSQSGSAQKMVQETSKRVHDDGEEAEEDQQSFIEEEQARAVFNSVDADR